MIVPFSLDLLPPESEAEIVAISNTGAMERRLLDVGFRPGTCVRCLFRAAAGDPTAYEVHGAVIALRRADARRILVVPTEGAEE